MKAKFTRASAVLRDNGKISHYEVFLIIDGFVCNEINQRDIRGLGNTPYEALEAAKLKVTMAMELLLTVPEVK